MNEEVDPALVVERLKVENALLKSELRFVTPECCTEHSGLRSAIGRGQSCRLYVLCRLLRGEAEGEDVGPELQQHLQGRIDLYLSDRRAELGVKLDSMLIVQAGEPGASQSARWRVLCHDVVCMCAGSTPCPALLKSPFSPMQ